MTPMFAFVVATNPRTGAAFLVLTAICLAGLAIYAVGRLAEWALGVDAGRRVGYALTFAFVLAVVFSGVAEAVYIPFDCTEWWWDPSCWWRIINP
jgi:hypothetical protein